MAAGKVGISPEISTVNVFARKSDQYFWRSALVQFRRQHAEHDDPSISALHSDQEPFTVDVRDRARPCAAASQVREIVVCSIRDAA